MWRVIIREHFHQNIKAGNKIFLIKTIYFCTKVFVLIPHVFTFPFAFTNYYKKSHFNLIESTSTKCDAMSAQEAQ